MSTTMLSQRLSYYNCEYVCAGLAIWLLPHSAQQPPFRNHGMIFLAVRFLSTMHLLIFGSLIVIESESWVAMDMGDLRFMEAIASQQYFSSPGLWTFGIWGVALCQSRLYMFAIKQTALLFSTHKLEQVIMHINITRPNKTIDSSGQWGDQGYRLKTG